jgi:Flp pilus assembly protein CpaB
MCSGRMVQPISPGRAHVRRYPRNVRCDRHAAQRGVAPARIGLLLTTFGLILSLVVGFLVYTQVSEAQQVKSSLPSTIVVVAATDIPPRTEIAASTLTVTTIPDPLIQAGAATRVEDVAGKFTPQGFVKGEVINTTKLGPLALKSTPSYTIEKGKVMYVMPVSFTGTEFSITRVNALRAGDRVDLLYTTIDAPTNLSPDQRDQVRADPIPYLQTRIMLQDLRIQDIGSYAADGTLVPAANATGATVSSASIIFVVTPEEALVLKWLKDAAIFYRDSSVEMVLRSPADEQQADTNLVVNFNYMRQKYNLAPPPGVSP